MRLVLLTDFACGNPSVDHIWRKSSRIISLLSKAVCCSPWLFVPVFRWRCDSVPHTKNPAIPECFHSSSCALRRRFRHPWCISCRDIVSRIFQAVDIIDFVTGMNVDHKKCLKGWTSPVGCFVSMEGLSSMKETPFLILYGAVR